MRGIKNSKSSHCVSMGCSCCCHH